jgi:hypothetical protein
MPRTTNNEILVVKTSFFYFERGKLVMRAAEIYVQAGVLVEVLF